MVVGRESRGNVKTGSKSTIHGGCRERFSSRIRDCKIRCGSRRQKSSSSILFVRENSHVQHVVSHCSLTLTLFFSYINASDPIKKSRWRAANPGLGVQNEDRRPSGSTAIHMISRSGLA